MATTENATPIRVIHNAAGHLAGCSRSLGGVVIGYLGVRVFTPQPVSKVAQIIVFTGLQCGHRLPGGQGIHTTTRLQGSTDYILYWFTVWSSATWGSGYSHLNQSLK
jgi:hypothetical protein